MRKRQRGFFDESARQARLEELGDPLAKLNAVIDWDVFRSTLESALPRFCREKGGRPFFRRCSHVQGFEPSTPEQSFRRTYTEFLITDRLTLCVFGEFLNFFCKNRFFISGNEVESFFRLFLEVPLRNSECS